MISYGPKRDTTNAYASTKTNTNVQKVKSYHLKKRENYFWCLSLSYLFLNIKIEREQESNNCLNIYLSSIALLELADTKARSQLNEKECKRFTNGEKLKIENIKMVEMAKNVWEKGH